MGRLIVFLLSLIIFLLLILVISKVIPQSGRKITHYEKRKSFDDDIEAVVKKVKLNS